MFLFRISLLLIWPLVVRTFYIDFRDLCASDSIATVAPPREGSTLVCSNCGCLNLNLSYLFHDTSSAHVEDLFELTYSFSTQPLTNEVCYATFRIGKKAIDYVDITFNSSSIVSRNVVFDFIDVLDTNLSLQGFCRDGRDAFTRFEWSTTELSISLLKKPAKFIFKPRDTHYSLGSIDKVSNVMLESEVLSDYVTYSSQGQSMSVSDVLKMINSNDCDLMGSSDAVLLNKVEYPPMNQVTEEGEVGVTVLCAIFTMEANHDTKVKAVTDTWARKCTQFLAFSTVNNDSIPSIHIPHLGAEEYRNMWQKTRSIWKYIHTHYRTEFDYFLLGGDDMYYVMENLYQYLNSEEIRTERAKGKGMYLGRTFKRLDTLFNTGGAGYLLDGVALELLVANLDEPHCDPHLIAPYEDLSIATCLNNSIPSIQPYSTIDPLNRQRFHPFTPGFHFTFVPSTHVPRLANDHWFDHYDHHIRMGFDCCSVSSIAFHFIWVKLMYDMDNYLYRCPQIAKDYYYGFYGETHYVRSIEVINREAL